MRRIWKQQDLEELAKDSASMITAQLVEKWGVTGSSIWTQLNKMGLKAQPTPYLNKGIFQKGHKTWNKGLRGFKASPTTSFKKGHVPANVVPIGTIRRRYHKRDRWYYHLIKVAKNEWIHYQRYVWLQAYGSIPEGKVIHFVNGDREDFRLENLKAVSRHEILVANRKEMDYAARRDNLINNDKYIASRMTYKDKALREELLKHPELIELKRQQIILQRSINGEVRPKT